MPPVLRRSLFVASFVASTAALAQSPVQTRQVGTATLQNVPEIPADVKASLKAAAA